MPFRKGASRNGRLACESASFEATADTKIAVKVIDARGNELMVVKTVAEALS